MTKRRRLIYLATAVVILVAAGIAAWSWQQRRRMWEEGLGYTRLRGAGDLLVNLFGGKSALANVQAPASVEAFRIEPEPAIGSPSSSMIGGRKILAGPVPVDPAAAKFLSEYLTNAEAYDWLGAKGCGFAPGVVFRFHRGSSATDVLICFDCAEMSVVGGGVDWEDVETDPLVPIVQRLFPGDSAIAELKQRHDPRIAAFFGGPIEHIRARQGFSSIEVYRIASAEHSQTANDKSIGGYPVASDSQVLTWSNSEQNPYFDVSAYLQTPSNYADPSSSLSGNALLPVVALRFVIAEGRSTEVLLSPSTSQAAVVLKSGKLNIETMKPEPMIALLKQLFPDDPEIQALAP